VWSRLIARALALTQWCANLPKGGDRKTTGYALFVAKALLNALQGRHTRILYTAQQYTGKSIYSAALLLDKNAPNSGERAVEST